MKWKKLRSTQQPGSDAKTILIWRGPNGLTSSLNIELLIANALKERGHKVIFISCDGAALGCVMRTIKDMPDVDDWQNYCSRCHLNGKRLYAVNGFEHHAIGDLLPPEQALSLKNLAASTDLTSIAGYRFQNVEVGLYALASTIRFFKGEDIPETDAYYQKVIRHYLHAALVNTAVAELVLNRFQPDRIFLQHGIYVDWGPLFRVALQEGKAATVWMRGYLRNHLYLRTSHQSDDFHMYFPPNNDNESRLETPLSVIQEQALNRFLNSQVKGNLNTHKLFEHDPMEAEAVRNRLNLNPHLPTWAMFTHLNWDAQFSFEAMLYPDTNTWAMETIRLMKTIKDVNWIVKIHPAERVLGTAKSVYQSIQETFGELPPHIHVLQPDTDINTYGLLPILDGGITISGTIGMELALRGKPAILAGEAHYGRKGFTLDADSRADYAARLKNVANTPPLTETQIQRAKRHAHYFFVQRQLPFELVADNGAEVKTLDFDNAILELICERILEGGEFIV